MNKKATANIKALNLIGSLFFIWGIAAIIDNIFKINSGIAPLLWMSYISLILLGIGILRKNASLVASQIAIIGIPYIFWNLDFFHQLITGNSLFGITDYFFTPGPLSGKIITLQHIFNIPLSLYSLHLLSLKSRIFPIVSMVQVSVVFIVSRIVTDYDRNVNCVYHNCANFSFGLPYIAEWFLAQFVMMLITSWFLIKIFKKKEK